MRTAVVVGGSIAGLLAAQVLTRFADEVVLVERDDIGTAESATGNSGGATRRGVPQGSQMHVLLEGGRRGIEQLLPGFTDDIVAAGAARACSGRDVYAYLDGRLRVPVGDLPMVSATRPFLEHHIRRRVLADERVRLRVGGVRGLVFSGNRVTGVRLTANDDESVMPADFVVDATGRAGRLGTWLAEAGWPEPELRRIAVDLGYATALFRTPADALEGLTVGQSLVNGPDGRVRLATIGRVEDDRWVALVAGYATDRPGRDPEDFLARCREDPAQEFGKLAADGELLGDIAVYRHPDNRRRDFHKLSRFPAGLVCVGDAVASFNPVYGQGMSSAAAHAACLADYLATSPSPSEPAWRYFKAIRRVVDEAWQTSVLNDLRLPHVQAPRPPGFAVATKLGDMVMRATVTDPVVSRRFLDVMHMLAGPGTLMRPGTLLRSARAARRDRKRN